MRPKLSVLDLVAQTAERSVSSGDAVEIAAVALIAAVVTRFFRPALRAVLTRLARRAKPGAATKWRARTPRLLGETVEQAELRRRQRIDTTARVSFLGAFSTRLEGPDATYHVPNRELTRVMNLSQRGSSVELAFEPSTEVPVVRAKEAIETAVRKRYVESVG